MVIHDVLCTYKVYLLHFNCCTNEMFLEKGVHEFTLLFYNILLPFLKNNLAVCVLLINKGLQNFYQVRSLINTVPEKVIVFMELFN